MPPRTRSHARPLAAWGFRPPCARAEQQAYDDVLLAQDLQISILETVGVLGIGLGAINTSWAAAVSGRRKTAWKALTAEPEKSFGGKGGAPGQLNDPQGVASLPDGAVCVADTFKSRLQIFSKEQGAAPRVIGGDGPDESDGMGEEPGQFFMPCGVACDGTALYVADSFNHRVQKLRLADGAHLGTVGKADFTTGNGEGQFDRPTSLCVAGGALYVCDTMNNRIVVLGTDLAWRGTIGREGSGDGEFLEPFGIAAHGGELYVVDTGNHRVQAWRPRPAVPRVAHTSTPAPPSAGVRAGPPRADALRARLRRPGRRPGAVRAPMGRGGRARAGGCVGEPGRSSAGADAEGRAAAGADARPRPLRAVRRRAARVGDGSGHKPGPCARCPRLRAAASA